MTAYRTAPLTPPVAPPWWQRAAAKVAPELSGARDWQWYRKQLGGRWFERISFTGVGKDPWAVEWSSNDECPLLWHRFTAEELDATAPLWRVDMLAQNRTIDFHRTAARPEGCTCEVYP